MNKVKNFLKNLGILLLVLFIFLFGSSFIQGIFITLGIKIPSLIVSLISNLFIILIIFAIFHKTIIKDFKDFKINWRKYMKITVKYWAIGLGVMMFSNLIINFFIFDGTIAGNEEAVRKMFIASPIIGLISAGLLAPMSEEMTFRLAFRNAFKNKYVFAFLSTFVFAGLHVLTDFSTPLDLLYFVPYGSLGFAFALAYYKTDNIFSTMTMHMIHNTVSFSLILISYLGV